MGEYLPGPNQQVVRDAPPSSGASIYPSQMNKEQLLELAAEQGVEADESMTKAEIRAALGH